MTGILLSFSVAELYFVWKLSRFYAVVWLVENFMFLKACKHLIVSRKKTNRSTNTGGRQQLPFFSILNLSLLL